MVRKKLGLDLRSKKVDGNRVYRIVHSSGARFAARPRAVAQLSAMVRARPVIPVYGY
jgi:hypothetical protein